MATLIAAFVILGVGLYAHHAQWKTSIVLLVCATLLVIGFGADLLIEPPPSRFDMN